MGALGYQGRLLLPQEKRKKMEKKNKRLNYIRKVASYFV